MGHVEMLAVMITQLLEKAPLGITENAAQSDPTVAAIVDGKGEFSYHEGPTTTAEMPPPTRPDARFYGTTDMPNIVEKVAGAAQDMLNKE